MIKRVSVLVAMVCCCTVSFCQIDTVSNLTTSDKLFGLGKFWSEASYNFAYFDHAKINWDSAYRAFIPQILETKSTWQYYQVMLRFCALLKDGHTDINFPGQLLNNTSRYRWIYIENFDRKLIVTDIPVQFKDQVPLGSELVSVDGVPVKAYAEKELLPYISSSTEHVKWNMVAASMFYGTDTAKVWHLKLLTPAGKIIDHRYQYHTYRAKWTRRTTNVPYKAFEFKIVDNVGVVTINTFGDEKVIDEFKAIVPQLWKCKATIIDIRKNGGGNSGIGAAILNYFTDDKLLYGSAWRTRDHLAAFKAWGTYQLQDTTKFERLDAWHQKAVLSARGEYWYQGDTMVFENNLTEKKIKTPLLVLVGNNTASAAEDFLIILSTLKGRATIIGQPTFGSTGQPLPITLPGLTGRICTKRDTYPDGRDFEGIGVMPDINVPKSVNDVLKGTDSEMEVAMKKLKVLK